MTNILNAAALAACFVVGLSAGASAHALDCRGRPIPSSTKTNCCGKADYHRIEYWQVSEDDAGYVVTVKDDSDGLPFLSPHVFHVPRPQALPTTDGCPAIFFSDVAARASTSSVNVSVFCLFYDPGT